jgi:hypothetical protein
MFRFAQFLQPTLATDAMPPDGVGQRSRASDAHVHERVAESWPALSSARREELFRWLRHDREGAR